MDNIIFRAAKCLAGSMPTAGSRLLSAVQQASAVLRARPSSAFAFSTAQTQLAGACTSSHLTTHWVSHATNSAVWNGGVSSRALNSVSPLLGPSATRLALLPATTPSLITTRGRAEIYYRPSAWKRVNKHGIEKRLRSPSGIEVLWRRVLKKRHCLTPFDRILPNTYNAQVLPKHHLKFNQHLVSREVRRRMNEALRRK
ncbi:uncharacterized protein LOC143281866 [Babylonia areolata]|uniref:uncharacterized protein LOC143281866 n=1 Tax=Babylonia areolata TaxID=304850 RepID=UPI003FD4D792